MRASHDDKKRLSFSFLKYAYFHYSTFHCKSKDGIRLVHTIGMVPSFLILRCRAEWVYRFCFPGSICCPDKIGGRPDKLDCLHLDRTCACVTKYIHFWMTKWVGGDCRRPKWQNGIQVITKQLYFGICSLIPTIRGRALSFQVILPDHTDIAFCI